MVREWFVERLHELFSFLSLPSKWLVDSHVVLSGNISLKTDWQIKSVGAGQSWVCPDGQYEVFAYSPTGSTFCDSSSRNLSAEAPVGAFPVGIWQPCILSMGWDGVALQQAFATCSEGWSFSSGEVLRVNDGDVFVVRFRRVG